MVGQVVVVQFAGVHERIVDDGQGGLGIVSFDDEVNQIIRVQIADRHLLVRAVGVEIAQAQRLGVSYIRLVISIRSCIRYGGQRRLKPQDEQVKFELMYDH